MSHKRANAVVLDEAKVSHEEIVAAAERFELTVAELDTYLQLLIDQHKDLELRVEAMSETGLEDPSGASQIG